MLETYRRLRYVAVKMLLSLRPSSHHASSLQPFHFLGSTCTLAART